MMTNTPLLDGDGAVIFILHSLSDVTALSQPLPPTRAHSRAQ